ncbi:MAG: hydroxyethylthiazole kinase [Clostridia bacterium]|nr:hydroxyethylthiazole kinase [Clostridia bacterium]
MSVHLLSAGKLIEKAAEIVDAVRQHNPLVDCITNFVTVNDCANILLAFGASPIMGDAFEDSGILAGISGAMYINIGTYIKEHESAAVEAATGAKLAGIPLVVDPVGCGAIPRGIRIVNHLHEIAGINIIKGNMAEIMALAGRGAEVKGVDSGGEIAGIEEAALFLAKQYRCVVAATGKADLVTDGERMVRIHNGVELLTKITGAGCMLPLTNNANLSRGLGMRHRAGVGISERSDAVAIMVSEQTGTISVAVDGMLKRHLSVDTFKTMLQQEILQKGSPARISAKSRKRKAGKR